MECQLKWLTRPVASQHSHDALLIVENVKTQRERKGSKITYILIYGSRSGNFEPLSTNVKHDDRRVMIHACVGWVFRLLLHELPSVNMALIPRKCKA